MATGDNLGPAQSFARLTDSSGGTASTTGAITAPNCRSQLCLNYPATAFANGDMMTAWTPGYAGKIVKIEAVCTVATSTTGKTATLNLEIGTTNLTGGVLVLDGTAAIAKGTVLAGTAITAGNTFTATDTISLEASSVTAFIEGEFTIIITLESTNINNDIATLAAQFTAAA